MQKINHSIKKLNFMCRKCRQLYNCELAERRLSSQGERAPVPVYGKTKQLNISKMKRFWHMVYRTKNVCFHPLNPFPAWTGPTRPGPARPGPTLTLIERLYLGNYHTYEKQLWDIKVSKWSEIHCIKIWYRYLY